MTPGAWSLRFLLAALLFFGGEILFWTELHQLSLLEWGVRLAGYLLLSTAVLDVLVRYRVRDAYVAMALFAGVGLAQSLLIVPGIAFEQFPVTLLTRVLGGYTVLSFFMFGAFVAALSGEKRRSQVYVSLFALWLGLCWGVWMRWIPVDGLFFEALSVQTMALSAGAGLSVVLLLVGLVYQIAAEHHPSELLLQPIHWLFVLLGLIGLFLVQALRGTLDSVMVVSAGVLLAFCWSILWSQCDDSGATLMNRLLPLRPLPFLSIAAAVALFALGAVTGYSLPRLGYEEFHQLRVLQIYLSLAGLVWLPFVAIVIAVRALDVQMRQGTGF